MVNAKYGALALTLILAGCGSMPDTGDLAGVPRRDRARILAGYDAGHHVARDTTAEARPEAQSAAASEPDAPAQKGSAPETAPAEKAPVAQDAKPAAAAAPEAPKAQATKESPKPAPVPLEAKGKGEAPVPAKAEAENEVPAPAKIDMMAQTKAQRAKEKAPTEAEVFAASAPDVTKTDDLAKSALAQRIAGRWVEPIPGRAKGTQGFEFFADGKAASVNMATLPVHRWSLRGDILTIEGESVGNGISFPFVQEFVVEKADGKALRLRQGSLVHDLKRAN